ncbi:MAG: copper amine oxidase N-terminal domain-containing protein [Armatimonadota bacterium]|nr:copper amine oxidase N-terminal domain-containing protein [Armatimonadota bacterium]
MLDARRVFAVVVAALAATTFAAAGTLTVQGSGGLSVDITCDVPPAESVSPEIAGRVSIAPVSEHFRDEPMMLYVDGACRGLTGEAGGRFEVEAESLGEGEHTFRVDAVRGEQLIASTGSIPLTVLSASEAATRQLPPPDLGDERPAFVKLYKPKIYREIVYFNNREADLERHAFIRRGRVYITLTDLMRHIGGSIIWGPDDDHMQVTRNDVQVTVYPHSRTVRVNGADHRLDRTTLRKHNRTYVPVRPFAAVFGIATEWDFQDDRAYVTYQE